MEASTRDDATGDLLRLFHACFREEGDNVARLRWKRLELCRISLPAPSPSPSQICIERKSTDATFCTQTSCNSKNALSLFRNVFQLQLRSPWWGGGVEWIARRAVVCVRSSLPLSPDAGSAGGTARRGAAVDTEARVACLADECEGG